MAATRLEGAEGHYRDYAADGCRVLYTSNSNISQTDNGITWNSSASSTDPAVAALLDVGGCPTPLSLETLTAFTSRIGAITTPVYGGYTDAASTEEVIDDAHYTSGTAKIRIKGFMQNESVDIAFHGNQNGTTGNRGGIYRLHDGREAEVINDSSSSNTGPVIFRDVAPVDGCIEVSFIKVTNFIYWTLFDMLVKRR